MYLNKGEIITLDELEIITKKEKEIQNTETCMIEK